MNNQEKIRMLARELQEQDIYRGFIETLDRFETAEHKRKYGVLTVERALNIFRNIRNSQVERKIYVVENQDTGEIIGTTTLLIEPKFIHNGMKVGHIEDVATRREYEGFGAGSLAVNTALEYAKSANCGRVVLDCSEDNVGFYEKLGFKRHEVAMRYEF